MVDDALLSGLLRAQASAREFPHVEDRYAALEGAVAHYADLRRARIREEQDAALDRAAHDLEEPERRLSLREEARQRVFNLTNPQTILAPANIIEVYRRDCAAPGGAPLWPSWSWDVTEEANRRMLRFVHSLDPDDPLADDPRIALPMTIGGFWLYRALHVDPKGEPRTSPSVVMAVYDEIAQGIAAVERSLSTPKALEELGKANFGEFCHVAFVAETLLLHIVRLGPEVWDLVLRCPTGADCGKGTPFYVAVPEDEDAHHGACRVAASRRRARERLAPPA